MMLNIYVKSLLGGIAAELIYVVAALLGVRFGVEDTLLVVTLAVLVLLALYIHWSKTAHRGVLYAYLVMVTGFMLAIVSIPVLSLVSKLGKALALTHCTLDPVADIATCSPIANFLLSNPLYILAFFILPIVGAILTFINLKTWFGRIAPHTVDPAMR